MEDVSTDEHSDFFIEITVSEPQKIGEGMGSYLAYKYNFYLHLRRHYSCEVLIHNYIVIFQSYNTYKHSKIQSQTTNYISKIQRLSRSS